VLQCERDDWADDPAVAADSLCDRRVIRQCLEALLFEGLVPYQLGNGYLCCELGGRSCRLPGYVGAFGRVRLRTEVDWGGRQTGLPPLHQILASLPVDHSGRCWSQLWRELQQTQTIWRHAQQVVRTDRRQLSYRQLERALIEGHPYHPCFKVREGFSETDNHRYGPESGQRFQLLWLAVRREFYRAQLPCNEAEFWQREMGADCLPCLPETWQDHYGLLPMHPWQWQQLQAELSEALAAGEVRYLGSAGPHYHATASVRTLFNADDAQRANIKLPLDIVATSSRRNLQPETVLAAPMLSRWLQTLLDGDDFLQDKQFTIQAEYAGIALAPPEQLPQTSHWLQACQDRLAVVFRHSVEAMLQHPEEQAIPFTALTAIETDGRPWLLTLLAETGVNRWVERLLDRVVVPLWHLLVHHGIALEVHAQNLVLVLKHGLPHRLIVKDFHESLEYVESFLAAPDRCPDFRALHPRLRHAQLNDSYWMEDTEALRELFVDTLFIYNLADLSRVLEEHYGYAETTFWQRLHHHLLAYNDSGITAPQRITAIPLHGARISTESLLTPKLCAGARECRHFTTNPLRAARAFSEFC
jgi:siderophore synthetase component